MSSRCSSPDRRPKRTLEERTEPWRVRRPLCEMVNAEPRVQEPRVQAPQQRFGSASQARRPVKQRALLDPLESIGSRAERSKEQVDALEKMLGSAMSPKVVLANTFTGLRNAIAEEIETALEVQWARGVKHGEWLAQQTIAELQAKLRRQLTFLRRLQSRNFGGGGEGFVGGGSQQKES